MSDLNGYYQALARDLLTFVGDEPWYSGQLHIETVWRRSTSTSRTRVFKGQSIANDRSPGIEVSGPSSNAALSLRDHLLETTGQRIWGLTFTLYPDGKFNLEYDYNRPEWYTDEEEQADLEAERADREAAEAEALGNRLNSLGIDVEIHDPSSGTEEHGMLTDALRWLRQRTERQGQDWGLGNEAEWHLDMNVGTLRFTFEDGREVVSPVQVIGTYNTADGTFMWGWNHPSVPEPLRRAAHKLRTYGEARGIERLTQSKLACTEADSWAFTAAAAQLDGAEGAYRGRAGEAWVYMAFGKPV